MQNTHQGHSPSVFARDEFTGLDAVAQADLVRRGELQPRQLLEAALARIEAVNPQLNAVVGLAPERAQGRAQALDRGGLLCGVPTLVKDLMAYPGLSTAFGSRALGQMVAPVGSAYTDAMDAAGLVVLGKSTTSELGLLGTTETLACGPTRNPWDLQRSTGGSSGGAVAAVASGMVPVAHASDGGGSIRGPASFTGVFGFKPSRGVTPHAGIPPGMPLAFMLSDHCVSRTVRDSAAWLQATWAGPQPLDLLRLGQLPATGKRLRIGVYSRDGAGQEPAADVRAALDETVALCEAAGHGVTPVPGPRYDFEATSQAFLTLSSATVAGLFHTLRAAMGPMFDPRAFEPYTQAVAARLEGQGADAVAHALAQVNASVQSANTAFTDVDVLLCPTTPCTAPRLGEFAPTAAANRLDDYVRHVAAYTAVASMAGWCAMSVPLCRSQVSGLPIGLHFAAPQGHDATLFALAYELEQLNPWC